MTPALSRANELHIDIHSLQGRNIRRSLAGESWPQMVEAFRQLYRVPAPTQGIGFNSSEREELCCKLIAEETSETFYDGYGRDPGIVEAGPATHLSRNLAEAVDGHLDSIYVHLYALLDLGLTPRHIELLMQEVHASNMTKTDDSGAPLFREDGKVLKGPNYIKADIDGLLREFGWQGE